MRDCDVEASAAGEEHEALLDRPPVRRDSDGLAVLVPVERRRKDFGSGRRRVVDENDHVPFETDLRIGFPDSPVDATSLQRSDRSFGKEMVDCLDRLEIRATGVAAKIDDDVLDAFLGDLEKSRSKRLCRAFTEVRDLDQRVIFEVLNVDGGNLEIGFLQLESLALVETAANDQKLEFVALFPSECRLNLPDRHLRRQLSVDPLDEIARFDTCIVRG